MKSARRKLFGARNIWAHGSVASSLSPTKLKTVLDNADRGDHHEFLTLAEEMEERDMHYASDISKRKLAIAGIEPVVIPADESAEAEALAAEIRTLIESAAFADLVDAANDALGKGYAAVELCWETSARQWSINDFKWRDPRFFRLDRTNGETLRLITDENQTEGVELSPYKWLVHKPRSKMGLPIPGRAGAPGGNHLHVQILRALRLAIVRGNLRHAGPARPLPQQRHPRRKGHAEAGTHRYRYRLRRHDPRGHEHRVFGALHQRRR